MNTRTAQQQTRHVTSTLFILACIAACIAAVGCTTKADSNAAGTGGFVPPATGGGVAPATGGVPAATGGVPAGTGGMAAGTGGASAAITMCGTTMCAAAPMGSPLAVCCQADGTCGLGIGMECLPAMAPGVLDPTCPAHMGPSSLLPGCCNAMKCGVMSASGLGCVERSKVATFALGPLTACACGTDGRTCGAPAGTGGTGTGGTGTGGTGTGGMGTGGTGTGGTGTGGTGTVSQGCMTYCTCMTANCPSATYPFPSAQTCQAFCAKGSAAALSCWNTHCTNAATMDKAMHCPHALGQSMCPAM